MSKLVLYHFPGACSQVCVFALEAAGLVYEMRLVDLVTNQQSSPDYAAISPLGKVPALLIDGVVLTENAAIQTYISELCPQAGLFPPDHSPLALARRQAGFSFCGGTLHPTIRGIANPARMTDGDIEPVREKSIYLAKKSFKYAETKLAEHGWWLGEWSILDVYLNWTVSVARNAGFDFAQLPLLDGLKNRLAERPAFRRMMEIDAEARATLEAQRKAA
jgi:glutathione S-transferase